MNPPVPIGQQPGVEDDADVYRYGRRYTKCIDEDGNEYIEESPLRYEDLLHPEEGDELVVVPGHSKDTHRLVDVLDKYEPPGKTFVVLDDMNVDLGLPGIKAIRPDIAVYEVDRIPDDFENLGTFHQVEHGGHPRLCIEVTSDSTRLNDLDPKFHLFEQAGFEQYIIVDRAHPESPQLAGYLLRNNQLQPQETDERGRLWLSLYQVWLGIEDGRLAAYDGEDSVPTYVEISELAEELAQERDELAGQLDIALKQASEREKRMQEMQAELDRLKGQRD